MVLSIWTLTLEAEMPKFLVIDTETGGLDASVHSLLSLGGVVWENGVQKAECEVLIREDTFRVTPEAMEVNRIDLVTHAKKAQKPKDAWDRFVTFLWENFYPTSMHPEEKIIPVSHTKFDIDMVKRLHRMVDDKFENYFSHRQIDTASILLSLNTAGRIPDWAVNSTGAFKYFGIEVPIADRHTALGDARATADLFTKLVELIRI